MLSLVLPVKDQADHIARIVERFVTALRRDAWSFELILTVNDSTDDSLAVCREAATRFAEVRCLSLAQAGWGNAVLVGLGAARGEILAFTNSARSRPEDLLLLLDTAKRHPEALVKAKRTRRRSVIRKLASALYNAENALLHGVSSSDVNGTPKILSRPQYRPLSLRERGDLLDLELLVACRRAGVPIVEVPLEASVRHGGKSTSKLSSALRMYWGSLVLRTGPALE